MAFLADDADDSQRSEGNGAMKDDLRSLFHLVSLGVVAAATIGVFFGVGFMWLTDPRPAAPPVDQVTPEQAAQAYAITAPGASPALAAEKAPATPISDTPLDGGILARGSTAMNSALLPPGRIIHVKRVRLGRHRYQQARRYWVASWRPDASAGPNPGGGFYGPPNSNIGYINPR